MKAKVIEFFRNLPKSKSEQFNKAFELYRLSPYKSIAAERVYNASGFSEGNLANLKYDLQKLHGIKDKEIVPGAVVKTIEAVEQDNISVENTDDKKEAVGNKGAVNTAETENKVADGQLPIREEFSFLNDKDCPNELKILVADKITAWNKYEEAHAKIQAIEAGTITVSEEEKTEVAKTAVEAFEENQRIYDELNAYKETGKVLGKHPIFKTLQLQREVEEMTIEQAIKFKAATAKYFTDNKQAREKAVSEEDLEKIYKIDERVAAREEKLALVDKKLGISGK